MVAEGLLLKIWLVVTKGKRDAGRANFARIVFSMSYEEARHAWMVKNKTTGC